MRRTGHKLGKNELRVRMYRVGFGDCFLISFPTDEGHSHVLVDFGVHKQGNIGTLDKIMNDIETETGKNLAIVIATHIHQDHISGFGQFADRFSQFRVKEVWLPWTENPEDKEADRLRKKQTKLHSQIVQFYNRSTKARTPKPEVENVICNLAPNVDAIRVLRSGFQGQTEIRYLMAGNSLKNPAGINRLSVKVLGPPNDPQFIAKMDPPKDNRYLRLAGDTSEGVLVKPFAEHFGIYTDSFNEKYPKLSLSPEKVEELKKLSEENPDSLAFTLDQAINNTSLVTYFSFGQERLLFPGDAQYGNWMWWTKLPDAEEVLSEVSFLKVAHHGSVNATPKNVLEKMGTEKNRFSAMVSTQNKPWESIPKDTLMNALNKHTDGKVVRSDSVHVEGAPQSTSSEELKGNFEKGDFWIDYIVTP